MKANAQRPVTLLVGSSSEEPMPVIVRHSGLRIVAVNKESVGLLDDTWDVLGVYFLFGHGSAPERYAAYVGEAGRRPLRQRLREHVRNKEDWNRALLITSDSTEGWDSAAIGWLEGRLHAVLTNATAAELLNRNTPRDESLPAYEREALEGYIRPVMAAMRALGYGPDTPDQRPPNPVRRRPRRYSESLSDLLDAGLLRPDTRLTPTASAFDRTAVVLSDGRLRVVQEVFDTPSGAAAAVTGRATNGWDFWGAPSGEGGLKPLGALRERLRASANAGAATADRVGPSARSTAQSRVGRTAEVAIKHESADAEPAAAEAAHAEIASFEWPRYRPAGVHERADVTVSHLFDAGLVEGAAFFAVHKGARYEVTSYGDDGLRTADEHTYPSLSAAAQAVTGRPTNGWNFWKTERDAKPVALSRLREQLLAMETQELASEDLRLHHIPPADASWVRIEPFALRFAGYRYVGGSDKSQERLQTRLDQAQANWTRAQALPDSLDELRVLLFVEQRKFKWTTTTTREPDTMPFIRALLERVRELVPSDATAIEP